MSLCLKPNKHWWWTTIVSAVQALTDAGYQRRLRVSSSSPSRRAAVGLHEVLRDRAPSVNLLHVLRALTSNHSLLYLSFSSTFSQKVLNWLQCLVLGLLHKDPRDCTHQLQNVQHFGGPWSNQSLSLSPSLLKSKALDWFDSSSSGFKSGMWNPHQFLLTLTLSS